MKILRSFYLNKRQHIKIQKHLLFLILITVILSLYFWGKLFSNKSPNQQSICTEPIDVVYTWVNGSDPELTNSIRKYNANYDHNRFDERSELKYSLRSVEKYAKWIRHIYIVTNGQVPHWLDLSSPRISIITHDQLSPDPKNNLPSFSSCAIETFIHRIPNLSKRFLYLNDDIFLNDDLFPEDLYTESQGFRIRTAWQVPDCAKGCPGLLIGNKQCNQKCNVIQCDFDGGDCLNNTTQYKNKEKKILSRRRREVHSVMKEQMVTSNSTTKLKINTKNHDTSTSKTDMLTKNIALKNLDPATNEPGTSTNQKTQDIFTTTVTTQTVTSIKKLNLTITTLQTLQNKLKAIPKKSLVPVPINGPDMFSRSLIHSNLLLIKEYGFKNRLVMSHVGFLLDIDIINDMHKKFGKEIARTASHRFRNSFDLQFAFFYFNFLMSETRKVTIEDIFCHFDTDKSNTLSYRETRIMLSRMYNPLQFKVIQKFQETVKNCSLLLKEKSSFNGNYNHNATTVEQHGDSDAPLINLKLISECPILKNELIKNFGTKQKYKSHQDNQQADNHFVMLSSNLFDAINAFDKLRKQPRKFVCINNDMNPKYIKENELINSLLEDYYISFFPIPSQFELPDNYRNRFNNLRDYEKWKNNKSMAMCFEYIINISLIGIFIIFIWLYRRKYFSS